MSLLTRCMLGMQRLYVTYGLRESLQGLAWVAGWRDMVNMCVKTLRTSSLWCCAGLCGRLKRKHGDVDLRQFTWVC